MPQALRYLLLQVRNAGDSMRAQEVSCFAQALHCNPHAIDVFDLLRGCPPRQRWEAVDVVLLGGSGDYSVAEGGPWLPAALDTLRELHTEAKPTFASCWGFQAMALARGGEVVTDLARAEIGTLNLTLTEDGRHDPIFAPLGTPFRAQAGHQDLVVRLPEDAIRLASSDRVENQAFRFANKPIYCTQFHPELTRATLLERARTYPQYVEKIAAIPFDRFVETCVDTPETEALLLRFVRHYFGD